jgi:carbon-monoxide dehydrogenase large subunit
LSTELNSSNVASARGGDIDAAPTGVGASLLRKEDDRFLHGRGTFLADIDMPRMLDVAFLRSPLAHGRINGIDCPEGAEQRVFTARDMQDVQGIRPTSNVPGHRIVGSPAMAGERVRFVGEIIAACLAGSRAEAEDLAEAVAVDLEDLPVVASMDVALAEDAPLVFEEWGTNLSMTTLFERDAGAMSDAPVRVTRTLDMARQAMVPLEGKGVMAYWEERENQLVVYSSTQSPHMIRNALCQCLGLQQRQVRVIAPDVGGGFGYKAILHPEEVIVAWLALRLKRPVRWLEDRFEHLTAGACAREHRYEITVHANERGRILGLEALLTMDGGAYSIWPHTNGFDAVQASGILTGPYDIRAYRVQTRTVVTNKPPLAPYRAVARPGACFAMETILDALAREIGRDPADVRLENLVQPGAMPYTAITGKEYDTGNYPEALRMARRMIAEDAGIAARPGMLVGTGYSMYTEHTAVSTSTISQMGVQMMPGFEQAAALMQPDGSLEIRIGVQSHGQGMETTMAQIASEVLGISPDRVIIRHGDTGRSPYSTGTYASRAIVMTGGAVAAACDKLATRLCEIAAHMMQCNSKDVTLKGGVLSGPGATMTIEEVATIWHFRPFELPEQLLRDGLEVTGGFRPEGDKAPFSYAAHAAKVAVDPELGIVELLDYVAVDDCGVRVNPMIVDGQILGGIAQGIGTGLYEEVPFDDQGQPTATTFGDYSVPAGSEIPLIRLAHMETPSPYTRFGVKGVGEGGAIGPPAAIVNAINNALMTLGAEISAVPATPERVLAAIFAAQDRQATGVEDVA